MTWITIDIKWLFTVLLIIAIGWVYKALIHDQPSGIGGAFIGLFAFPVMLIGVLIIVIIWLI